MILFFSCQNNGQDRFRIRMNGPPEFRICQKFLWIRAIGIKQKYEFSFIERLLLFFITKIERVKDVTFMVNCRNISPRSLQVPAVQGLPEAHPGGDEPVRARHGHRAREHRVQLRHAGGHGHLPPQGRQGGQIRHQGQTPPPPPPQSLCSILVKWIKLSSVGDPWHFATDPDPRIPTSA